MNLINDYDVDDPGVELVKLTPLVALGAFAVPALQKPLLKAGLGFSDWASGKLCTAPATVSAHRSKSFKTGKLQEREPGVSVLSGHGSADGLHCSSDHSTLARLLHECDEPKIAGISSGVQL